MKLNGSIYYSIISQDNAGVDMAALERVPCPEPSIPPRYQRLWIRRGSGGSPARPLSHLGPPPPVPFAHLPWTGPGQGRGRLERAECPTETERASGPGSHPAGGDKSGTQPPHALTACSSEKPLIPGHTASPSQGSRSPVCPLILTFSSVEIHVLHHNPLET